MEVGRAFLVRLREEVASHPGVGHSVLGRMTLDPRSREDFRILGEQHYPLVTVFTRYLELLLLSAPDSESKTWLAKVLVDEYGEGSRGLDHAALYLSFLKASGVPGGGETAIRLHPCVVEFIETHLKLVAERPFLVGLGAVGPGHEWAIPAMFAHIVAGLKKAGYREAEIEYFTLHLKQDEDHGAWLEEALERLATTEHACAQIREGAMASLAAREAFWWGLADKLNARRMQMRTGATPSTAGSDQTEITLEQLRERIRPTVRFG